LKFTNNGTERGRWDSSGRFLVGTSSGSFSTTVKLQGNSGASTGESRIRFCRGQATPADGASLGIIGFSDNTETPSAEIVAQRDGGTWSASSVPGRLVFSTTADGASSPTERMRINNSGFVLVGTQSNAENYGFNYKYNGGITNGLYVASTATSGDGSFLTTWSRGYTINNTSPALSFTEPVGTRFEVRNNGGIANYSANDVNLSDINSKKDIAPAASTWSCLKEWEVVNFRYKEQPDDADLNLGVIAQQVAESCPEVITVFQEAKEATETQPAQEERLGVKEQQMMWIAIKALQEAQLRIETLEAEVAALKGA
jgi:hypothetical protein